MHLNPAGTPTPLSPPAWPPTNRGAPSPCCCPAEGHHPQGAWGPQCLGPRPLALTSPPAGPVRTAPGVGVPLGCTPLSAWTDAGHTAVTMWVGAAGPPRHPGRGPGGLPTAKPRGHPSQYLGLGLLHPVLRRQQLLIDLLQARSSDLSPEKGARRAGRPPRPTPARPPPPGPTRAQPRRLPPLPPARTHPWSNPNPPGLAPVSASALQPLLRRALALAVPRARPAPRHPRGNARAPARPAHRLTCARCTISSEVPKRSSISERMCWASNSSCCRIRSICIENCWEGARAAVRVRRAGPPPPSAPRPPLTVSTCGSSSRRLDRPCSCE